MTAARVRTARVPDGPAFRLMLIVLVAACGGQPALAQTAAPGGHRIIRPAAGGHSSPRDLRFRRLTTNDGLSQNNVVAIVQDRRGFMWFGTARASTATMATLSSSTRNDPNDPGSLSHNFVRRCGRRRSRISVGRRVSRHQQVRPRDRTQYPLRSRPEQLQQLQRRFGCEHHRRSVAAICGSPPWTAGWTGSTRRPKHSRITGMTAPVSSSGGSGASSKTARGDLVRRRPRPVSREPADGAGHASCPDDQGPVRVRRVRRQQRRFLAARLFPDRRADQVQPADEGGSPNIRLARALRCWTAAHCSLTDANGFWVPSSLGLSYFDRRTERFTRLFQHDRDRPGQPQR